MEHNRTLQGIMKYRPSGYKDLGQPRRIWEDILRQNRPYAHFADNISNYFNFEFW
jgi:hypothetical protein